MLLRASGEFAGEDLDLESINARGLEQCGIADAPLLVAFADALAGGDAAQLSEVRDQVRSALGEAALVDTCAVAAVFNAVVRIADATGIPLEAYKEEISTDLRRDLGIDAY